MTSQSFNYTILKSVICFKSLILAYIILTQEKSNRIYYFIIKFNKKERNEKCKTSEIYSSFSSVYI